MLRAVRQATQRLNKSPLLASADADPWDLLEDDRPAGKPETHRTHEEFLRRVSDRLEGAAPIDPEAATHAAFAAMQAHVPEGKMARVIQMVPRTSEISFRSTEAASSVLQQGRLA